MFGTVPLSIVRSFSLYTQQWYKSYGFADSKLSANLYVIYHCCVYSEKLLTMDRGTVRNMQSFIPKINLINQYIQFYYKKRMKIRCFMSSEFNFFFNFLFVRKVLNDATVRLVIYFRLSDERIKFRNQSLMRNIFLITF